MRSLPITKQFFCDSSRVLRRPAGLGECDFGSCYDRAAHPPTSIALQCWGIPKSSIRILLTTMQMMQYVLRTGFGESTESYGGTTTAPNSGLGQGSGASPPRFLALSSLIVNAYRRMGHGARITSSYTRRLFHLAAVMYVDDTDLLHWPGTSTIDPEELIAEVQQATTDYGKLAIASGGILKEKKCSVYILDYKWVQGRARLKLLTDLPAPQRNILEDGQLHPSHITIPQPEGPDLPIITHEVTVASKMLGVHFSPAGKSLKHIEHIVQKGLDWVDAIRAKPVSRQDAWLSFHFQLLPGMSWGIVTTLPERYQGLGMPNMPLLSLQEKISFLLGNWGFSGQAHSDALAMAYKNFLIEVGLYESPLQWGFPEYGHLVTHSTWFQNLWELTHTYQVEISFRAEDMLQGIRENDWSLMAEFYRMVPSEADDCPERRSMLSKSAPRLRYRQMRWKYAG
jgi:hypothetical protein